jgi:hypothetical protein
MSEWGEAIAALSALVLYIVDTLRRKRKELDAYGQEIKDREEDLMDAIRRRDHSGVNRALNERVRCEHQVE